MSVESVLAVYSGYEAAFREMLRHDPQKSRPDYIAAHQQLLAEESAVIRAALAYAAEPEPVAGSYGGAFALSLHNLSRRAAHAGLEAALEEYEVAAFAAPPSRPLPAPPGHLEILANIGELAAHVRELDADRHQEIIIEQLRAAGNSAHSNVTIGQDGALNHILSFEFPERNDAEEFDELGHGRTAAAIAGGAADAVAIGDLRRRAGGLREHLRRHRWAAGVRTVGASSIEHELVTGNDLAKVLDVVLAAREQIPPGCTVDIYRRTAMNWALKDTFPALEPRDRIKDRPGGEVVRAGEKVIGRVHLRAGRWIAERADAGCRVAGTRWKTRTAAAESIRRARGSSTE